MAFSEIELKRIDNLVGEMCRNLTNPEFKDELSLEYKVQGHDVVVFEKRPGYGKHVGGMETDAAKIKYVRTKSEWRLYWMRQDLKWHGYEMLSSSKKLEDLVEEIEKDPFCCFFG